MWELLTLRSKTDLNNEMAHVREEDYWGPMHREAIAEIQTTRDPEYSYELREMIRKCLRISPRKRPEVQRLYTATLKRLERMVQAAKDRDTGLKNGARVFYMGNEINDMPLQIDLHDRRAIPYYERAFKIFNRAKFVDPELESLFNGRWDPRLHVKGGNIPSPIPGGRKRRQSREAYVFMPDKDNPRRVVKKIRLAQDFEDDQLGSGGDHDGDDGHTSVGNDDGKERGYRGDNENLRGQKRGGGKSRGGKDRGISRGGKSRGISRGGIASTGKGRGSGRGGNGSNREGGGNSRSRNGNNIEGGSADSANSQPSTKDKENRNDKQKGRKEVHESTRESVLAQFAQAALALGLSSWSANPRDQPEDGVLSANAQRRSANVSPSPQRQRGEDTNGPRGRGKTRARGSRRGRGRTGRQGGRGRDGDRGGGGPRRQPPRPRHADQHIVQQDLPALQTQQVGGRALRPRR